VGDSILDEQKASSTRWKNISDLMKHITTLSSGSALLLATFADKFPKNANSRYLLGCGMAGMLAALLGSLLVMFVALKDDEGLSEGEKTFATYCMLFVILGFFGGVSCIGLFAIFNF
jgi:hypothetical protein